MISKYIAKGWLPVTCAAVVILLDQWSKQAIRNSLELFEGYMPLAWLGEIFYLEHVPNYGAAFGLLPNASLFFLVTSVLVTVAILVGIHFVKSDQIPLLILIGMALGGAIGNFIDRLTLGYVTDFLKFGIPGKAYWPNFNVADASITVSVILLTILTWREDSRRPLVSDSKEPLPDENLASSASENSH